VRNLILQKLGVTETLSTVWQDEEWSQLTQGTVHHAGGTLRMSDDGSGVVDEDLKFEGLERLYCCDVSVFPTIPAANPSLTLAALALRLADTLAGKLGL
jgi:choline dehydrogenase-like flavoprotein